MTLDYPEQANSIRQALSISVIVWLFILSVFTSSFALAESTATVTTQDATANSVTENTNDSSYQSLLDSYHYYQPQLAVNNNKSPIIVHSHVNKNDIIGVVYAILPHSFMNVKKLLQSPANWCNASLLNINVKSCTVENELNESPHLNLYVGNKDYQLPDEAFHFEYDYTIAAQKQNYIQAMLTADSGPFDSKNYVISVDAISISETSSFIKLRYSAYYGFLTRMLLKTYLATAGRKKVGFTVLGTNNDGSNIHIKGIEGLIERNAMRYMLALISYMNALSYPQEQQFEESLVNWFNFSKKYKEQLYEVGKKEYLDNKYRERDNQNELQFVLNQTNSSLSSTTTITDN